MDGRQETSQTVGELARMPHPPGVTRPVQPDTWVTLLTGHMGNSPRESRRGVRRETTGGSFRSRGT